MITEIYIENQRLDLFDDIGSELNFQIDDIKDFSSRNTNYSKTITIPGNANNNKIFGHIYNFGSANNYFISDPNLPNVGYNFDPSKQANAKIFINKIQVFKGVIRLLEIKIDKGYIEYECAVFGEFGGFVNDIGKLLNNKTLLEDLDTFNKYNQAWTYENIVGSWNASGVPNASGIVYPLIDYGQCKVASTTTAYHLNAFRPAFFVKEILDSIIYNAGYTYTSNFFNSDFFKTLIIPNNRANLEQIRRDLLSVIGGNARSNSGDITFGNIVTLNLFTNGSNTYFTFNGTNGTLGKVILKGSFMHSRVGNSVLRVYKNAVILQEIASTSGYNNQQFNIDWAINTTLNANDVLSVHVDIVSADPDFTFDPNFEFDFNADYAQPSNATAGVTLNMQNLLPKGIEQKDFFLSICRMFNLYVYEDSTKSNHLKIEPFIDFYGYSGFVQIDDTGDLVMHGETGDTGLVLYADKSSTVIDWTDKVDRNEKISIKPMSEINSRYYDFKYQEDEDFYNDTYQKRYNQTYGDRLEDTKFQFSNDKKELSIIFAPTFLVTRSGDEKLASNIFKVESNNVEVPFDSKIRILQYKYKSGVTAYNIKGVYPDTTTNYGTRTDYGFAGHLDDPTAPTRDLNFGVPKEVRITLTNPYPTANLFTAYWGDYLGEIISKDSKLISCYLYLTTYDIYSLDFSKLIYIDGSLFRLNKVIDFDGSKDKSTQVELLKVIELSYN